jgi:hypothetical protein
VSLTGALEAFPLPDVLQLLSRSQKSGALRVNGKGIEGKIFFSEGDLTYATTRSEESLGPDLIRAGLVDEGDWQKVERKRVPVLDVLRKGVDRQELEKFVEEHVHDVLFRLLRLERGTFEFLPELQPRYATGQTLSVELSLEQARSRLAKWQDIEAVIPGMNLRMAMAPGLGAERGEILLDAEGWQVLSGLRGVGSVEELAQRLGATDFQVAKVMAQLVRDGLVVVIDQVAETPVHPEEPTDAAEPEIAIVTELPVTSEEDAQPEEEADDDDETSLLRVALSGVVNVPDEEGGHPEQTVPKRRGLGSLARDARSD